MKVIIGMNLIVACGQRAAVDGIAIHAGSEGREISMLPLDSGARIVLQIPGTTVIEYGNPSNSSPRIPRKI